MEGLYEEAEVHYKSVYSSMVSSTNRVKLTSATLLDLHSVFVDFARSLERLTTKFNAEILHESEGENERLLNSYQLFSNSLLKISEVHRKLASQLKNQVVDPYLMFIENYRQTNRGVSKRMQSAMQQLTKQRDTMLKQKQLYYQSWLKTQKSKEDIEKAIEKIEKGGKNNDLVKANDQSLKLSMATEELEREYRDSIDRINNQWVTLSKQFEGQCTLFDYNEESRLSFSRNTVVTALRVFTEFGQLNQSEVEAKSKQAEDMVKLQNKRVPFVKSIGNGRFYQFLEMDKKESFVSYQESKRKKEGKKEVKADPNKEIFKSVKDKDRELIDSALDVWLGETLSKDKPIPQLSRQEMDHAKSVMVASSAHSFFLLETLHNRILKTTSYYFKLDEEYFNDLLNVFLWISRSLENLVNERSVEYLYKMINISMRIMKKKRTGQPRELLCTFLGKDNPTFLNEKLWLALLNYITNKAIKKKQEEQDNRYTTFGKGLMLFARGINNLVTGKKEELETDPFQPTQQIATLLSSLSVSTEFSLPLVRKMLNGQSGPAFQFLKESLYTKQDIQLRQKLTDPKQVRLKKDQKLARIHNEKLQGVTVLKIVAKSGLLDQHCINIRLACRELQDIDKEILSLLNIPKKWVRILRIKERPFEELKKEADEKGIPPATEEIIMLDVNRSLHVHSDYFPPGLLNSMLKVYACHNQELLYCQGMNYLAGYLYIRLRDVNQAYEIFEDLMKHRFAELFAKEFHVLKIKMYQFDRLLHIFLPDVAEHFKRQMISSECYIVSWVITLFSAAFQTARHSYLVDVLWDRFVVHGWREFFRFTIFLFNLYKVLAVLSQDELVEMTFDRALNFLSDLIKNPIFKSTYQQLLNNCKKFDVRTLNQQLDAIPISNKLLERLRKEHQLSETMDK